MKESDIRVNELNVILDRLIEATDKSPESEDVPQLITRVLRARYDELRRPGLAMPVAEPIQETRDAAKPIATGKMGAFHYLESLDEMRLAELERQSGCDQ